MKVKISHEIDSRISFNELNIIIDSLKKVLEPRFRECYLYFEFTPRSTCIICIEVEL